MCALPLRQKYVGIVKDLFTSDEIESIGLGIRELKFYVIQLEKLQLRMAKVIELP